MKLFSWFMKSNDINPKKVVNIPQDSSGNSINANSMWPIAKVRYQTTMNQKTYINTALPHNDNHKENFSNQLNPKNL